MLERGRPVALAAVLLLGPAACGKPASPKGEASSGGEQEADEPRESEREDDRDPDDVVPPLPLAPA
jgi:hypothetical protein